MTLDGGSTLYGAINGQNFSWAQSLFNVFRGTQTDLDLNGPNLSFLQNVSDVIVDNTGGGNAHLLELQIQHFPNPKGQLTQEPSLTSGLNRRLVVMLDYKMVQTLQGQRQQHSL